MPEIGDVECCLLFPVASIFRECADKAYVDNFDHQLVADQVVVISAQVVGKQIVQLRKSIPTTATKPIPEVTMFGLSELIFHILTVC